MERRIDRQFQELRNRASTDDDLGRNGRPGNSSANDQDRSRRSVTCYNCNRAGHISRNCRQPRRPFNRRNDVETTETEAPPPLMNHTTRPRLPDRASSNAVYIRGSINGRQQMCLIDTGYEVSLIPSTVVEGLALQSCSRFLMAANGTSINVLGEVRLPIKIRDGFEVSTVFLVSDQITEPMLGMDWLREHRCRIGFGNGALFLGRRRVPLVKGNGSMWCRRVIIAEEVVVPPKCQSEVSVKTLYGDLTTIAPAWMTEAQEIQPGVHLARVVVGDRADASVRVVNLSDETVTLTKDRFLGGLHPVEVELGTGRGQGTAPVSEISPRDMLMADLPEEVPSEIRERLDKLLLEYRDVFSVTDRDLGRTTAAMHRIETDETRPVRQPLRRHPLPHRTAIDSELDRTLNDGLIESAISKHAFSGGRVRRDNNARKFYRQQRLRFKRGRGDRESARHIERHVPRRTDRTNHWLGRVTRFRKWVTICGRPPTPCPLLLAPNVYPWERVRIFAGGPLPVGKCLKQPSEGLGRGFALCYCCPPEETSNDVARTPDPPCATYMTSPAAAAGSDE